MNPYRVIKTLLKTFLFKKAPFAGVFLFIISNSILALGISLKDNTFYVRQGFDFSKIESFTQKKLDSDTKENAWVKVIPAESGDKSLSFKKLNRELKLPQQNGIFEKKNIQEVTYVTFFDLNRKTLENIQANALLIEYLGINWRVYLNGKIIHNEIFSYDGHDFTTQRRLRNVEVPIDSRLLKLGENTLVFHVLGYSNDHRSGFRHSLGMAIKDKKEVKAPLFEIQNLIFTFLYFVISLFFLALFWRHSKDLYNFFFCLGTFLISIRVFSASQTAAYLLTDTHLALLIEYISSFWLVPVFVYFIEYLVCQKIRKISHLFFIAAMAQSVLMLFPYPNLHALNLQVWQVIAMLSVIYVVGFVFIPDLRLQIHYAQQNISFAKALKTYLAETSNGQLFTSLFVFFLLFFIEVVWALLFLSSNFLIHWLLLVFVIALAFIIANKHMKVFNQVDTLKEVFDQKELELSGAYEKLSRSENTFKTLVEGAKIIIITADTGLNILSSNAVLKKNLGFQPQHIEGKNINEILFHDELEHRISNDLFLENLKVLLKEKKEINCKAYFRSAFHSEPVEMDVKMQYIALSGGDEILLQATFLSEDKLIKFFVSEKQNYLLGNFLIQAEEISHRLVMNLPRYLNKSGVAHIRICLREILINAIEHGNLGVTFDEKTQQQTDGDYFRFIYLRQQQPQYRSKKVRIQYVLRPTLVAYKITDDGDGFDHKKVMAKVARANEEELAHGRGIMMAKNYFDKIVYNKKGNSVILIKYFSRKAS